MNSADYTLFHNEEENQFEFHIETFIPKIEYIRNNVSVYYLTHTEVPVELEGKGVGKQLVEKVLTEIENMGSKMVPICPFVAAYIRRHPEWKRIIAF